MGKAEIIEKLFNALYDSWEHNTSCFLDQLRNEHGWGESVFEDVVDDLESHGLIENRAQWDYRATARGILFAEKQGIVPKERSAPHRETRRKILAALAGLRKEKGKHEIIYYEKLCQEGGIDESLFHADEQVLCEQGLIEAGAIGCYRITDGGLRYI